MRLVPTGRTPNELVERADVTHCSSCGEPFARRLFTKSWTNCLCVGGPGHRVYICLRDPCRGETFDPPHVIQHGPTADYH